MRGTNQISSERTCSLSKHSAAWNCFVKNDIGQVGDTPVHSTLSQWVKMTLRETAGFSMIPQSKLKLHMETSGWNHRTAKITKGNLPFLSKPGVTGNRSRAGILADFPSLWARRHWSSIWNRKAGRFPSSLSKPGVTGYWSRAGTPASFLFLQPGHTVNSNSNLSYFICLIWRWVGNLKLPKWSQCWP